MGWGRPAAGACSIPAAAAVAAKEEEEVAAAASLHSLDSAPSHSAQIEGAAVRSCRLNLVFKETRFWRQQRSDMTKQPVANSGPQAPKPGRALVGTGLQNPVSVRRANGSPETHPVPPGPGQGAAASPAPGWGGCGVGELGGSGCATRLWHHYISLYIIIHHRID